MRQRGALRMSGGSGLGPFAQPALDEALGFAVGARGVGFCSDVLELEAPAGLGEGLGSVA